MESKISLNSNPPPPYQSTVSLNTLTHLPPYQSSISVNKLGQSSSTRSPAGHSWIHNDAIWSSLIPLLPPSTLSALSRTCKSVYHHVIPHLWKVYRIESDDQLWNLLYSLGKENKNQWKGWLSKGKGKLSIFKRSNRPSSFSTEDNRPRIRSLLDMVRTIIFDIIPSPTLCALIPRYLPRSSNLTNIIEGQDECEREQEKVLFPNVDQIHFTPRLIKEGMKFGWRPFQHNDYYSHLLDGVKRELPNKYSQLPFAHLAKPQILYMDFPSFEKGKQQQQESYYDELSADGVPGTSLSFLTSLEDIHIILPVTFDLSTGEVIQFLKGRKHFIHLPKEWFINPPILSLHNEGKYEDELENEDEDELEYDDHNERSTLIRYLTYFLEEIMHADILMNYPCKDKMDEDHYRLNCKTRWIIRYPPFGQGIMKEVKDNLLEMVDRGEIERLARDGIVMVDGDERREDVKEMQKEGIGGKSTTEKVGDDNGESKVELWFMRFESSQCLR